MNASVFTKLEERVRELGGLDRNWDPRFLEWVNNYAIQGPFSEDGGIILNVIGGPGNTLFLNGEAAGLIGYELAKALTDYRHTKGLIPVNIEVYFQGVPNLGRNQRAVDTASLILSYQN